MGSAMSSPAPWLVLASIVPVVTLAALPLRLSIAPLVHVTNQAVAVQPAAQAVPVDCSDTPTPAVTMMEEPPAMTGAGGVGKRT